MCVLEEECVFVCVCACVCVCVSVCREKDRECSMCVCVCVCKEKDRDDVSVCMYGLSERGKMCTHVCVVCDSLRYCPVAK